VTPGAEYVDHVAGGALAVIHQPVEGGDFRRIQTCLKFVSCSLNWFERTKQDALAWFEKHGANERTSLQGRNIIDFTDDSRAFVDERRGRTIK
jgi:hypothetical protein